jgi:hypothetical protein
MLTGVGILLERMKTNPEEFIEGDASKWSRVMGRGWDIFTEEERTALQDALNEAKREHFNGEVMRVLAQGHDELDLDPYLVKGKIPMQGNRPSAIVAPQSMMNQTTQILRDEFDKAYAKTKAPRTPNR